VLEAAIAIETTQMPQYKAVGGKPNQGGISDINI